MIQIVLPIVLLGFAAGVVSAVLFASAASGAMLSVLLFYLAPLPIVIAALGWSQLAGLVAAASATAALALAFGLVFALAFLASVAAPAWWLSHLSLLARPGHDGADLEWYPPGRLVLWAAVIGAAVVAVGLLSVGSDAQTIRSVLRRALEDMLGLASGQGGDVNLPGVGNPERLIGLLVTALPAVPAVILTVAHLVNLFLGALAVRVSAKLKRPWPQLAAISFPTTAVFGLAAALAGCFIPELPGLIAMLFAATMVTAFAILGFAVLHAATRNISGRTIILSGAYGAVLVFVWPAIIVALLGLTETLFRWPRRDTPPLPGG